MNRIFLFNWCMFGIIFLMSFSNQGEGLPVILTDGRNIWRTAHPPLRMLPTQGSGNDHENWVMLPRAAHAMKRNSDSNFTPEVQKLSVIGNLVPAGMPDFYEIFYGKVFRPKTIVEKDRSKKDFSGPLSGKDITASESQFPDVDGVTYLPPGFVDVDKDDDDEKRSTQEKRTPVVIWE